MRKARFSAAGRIAAAAATLALFQPGLSLAQQAPPAPPAEAPADAPPADEPPAETPPAEAPDAPAEAPEDTAPAERAPGATGTPAPATPPAPGPEVEELPPARAPEGPLPPPTEGTPPRGGGAGAGLGFGQWAEPTTQPALAPADEQRADDPDRVLAEDWWSHTRPSLELHGYFRVRWEMFYNFHLGRIDHPADAMFPRPADSYYRDLQGLEHGPALCTQSEAGTGGNDNPAQANRGCNSNTHSGANMRLRLEPTLVISDNLRIRTQIDLLDNVVLGSTPGGYRNVPSANGYAAEPRDRFEPVAGLTYTQTPPRSGINSLRDSVMVKRAWGEYTTPVGQLRFGRMPDHWGLGIYRNAGDDFDGDFQTTVDRIAFFTAIPALSLHIGGAWDFQDELPTSEPWSPHGGQIYDLGQQDDLDQYNLIIFRRVDAELERLHLAQGRLVLNGGLYLTYRNQRLAAHGVGPCGIDGGATLDCSPDEVGGSYVRRGLSVWTPDLWFELKYRKFHFDTELVTHQGTVQSTATPPADSNYQNPNGRDGWRINQWGLATRIRQRLVEDRLELGFQFGYASGDGDVEGLTPRPYGTAAGQDGVTQLGDRSLETFRFHPNYRIDLILHRHILNRVQGTYYFRPSARYDFIRRATGLRLGGIAEAIWTRASQFMQAPGHESDLGIELNATVYFQSRDGALNDSLQQMGGFYTAVQYGVLFPMAGLGYQAQQTPLTGGNAPELATAQTVRWLMGVIY